MGGSQLGETTIYFVVDNETVLYHGDDMNLAAATFRDRRSNMMRAYRNNVRIYEGRDVTAYWATEESR